MSTAELLDIAYRGLAAIALSEGTWCEPWPGVTDEQQTAFEATFKAWLAATPDMPDHYRPLWP